MGQFCDFPIVSEYAAEQKRVRILWTPNQADAKPLYELAQEYC